MKILTTILLTSLTAPALAQDMGPAAQLEKFHVLVGSFEGSGTFVPMAGMDAQPWTASATGTLVLGGHVVQFDEEIQVPGGSLSFRTLYGWDAERSRPVMYWVGSMGVGAPSVTWADDHTLLAVTHGTEEGVAYAERATTIFDEAGYAFQMERLSGLAPALVMVSGEMKRVSKGASRSEDEASAVGEEMAKLTPMVGSWSMTGEIDMMGMQMDITGTEQAGWILGGAVLGGHIDGEPDYQSDWYICWDAEADCYRHLYASSMGELGMATGHMVEDQMIFTEARLQFGQPVVSRGVVQFEDGGISRVWTHAITGAADPVRAFEATYQRAGAKPVSRFSPGSCCAKAEQAGGACKHPCCVKAATAGEVCAICNK